MSKEDCCPALSNLVKSLLWCALLTSGYAVAYSADSLTGSASEPTSSCVWISSKVVHVPASLEQDFLGMLPLSPIQIGSLNPVAVQGSSSGPESLRGEEGVFPFHQAILSKEQVTEVVRWIDKHKTSSMAIIPPVKTMYGEQGEIELLTGSVAEFPVPQNNEIGKFLIHKMSDGIKLRLSSSREADKTKLKCEWDSKEFVYPNNNKVARNIPEAIKSARFHMEHTVPDGHTLVLSGFTRNSGTREAEGVIVLIDVTPVTGR